MHIFAHQKVSMKPTTKNIRTQTPKSENREHSTPIYLTSSFCFENAEQGRALFADEIEGNIYSRFSNPNTDEFAEKVVLLENAEDGLGTATGMSAIFISLMAFLEKGDHVLISLSVFGSTYQIAEKLFPKWGITHTFLEIEDFDTLEKFVTPKTKMLFLETPTNPGLDIVDLEKVGTFCKANNLIFNVDNCFSTPIIQKPIEYGADLVVHSATKYIDGQGRVLGGVVVGKKELISECRFLLRNTGPSLSPFNGWVLSKSMETLELRMEKHCENALYLATKLQNEKKIKTVKYPFLPSHPQFEIAKRQMKYGGGMITLELNGGLEEGKRFLDALKMISLSANLGDTRSIATHPASTTHSKLSPEIRERVGISDSLVRISVGLEDKEDIFNDIIQALQA